MTSTIGQGLPFGKVERSQGRTVGEGEFAVFASLTWTTRERNANKEFMAGAGETDRELAAPVVVAIVASLAALGPLNRALHEEYGVRTLAAMGLEAEFFASGAARRHVVGGERGRERARLGEPSGARGADVARPRGQPAGRGRR